MKQHSFGIIPARKSGTGIWKFLLIQHHAGHWGFPKGGAEHGEDALQAATRELFEETGLRVSELLAPNPLSETYFFTADKKKIVKTVDYFLASVKGRVVLQAAEIKSCKWVIAEEAAKWITFPQAKRLCEQAFLLLP